MRYGSARQALEAAVSGDLASLGSLSEYPDQEVLAASQLNPLIVSKAAVIRVLQTLQRRGASEDSIQRWASFIRWGIVPTGTAGPVDVVEVDWDETGGNAIGEAIARLDELGDLIDGTIDATELHQLLEALAGDDKRRAEEFTARNADDPEQK